MTIDVSTPTARQVILDEHRFYADEVHPETMKVIEAAFARIDTLEEWYKAMHKTADKALDRNQEYRRRIDELEDLARDLADAVETLLDEHRTLVRNEPDGDHEACAAVIGSKEVLVRARAAGVLP